MKRRLLKKLFMALGLIAAVALTIAIGDRHRAILRAMVPAGVTQFIRDHVPQYTSEYIRKVRVEYKWRYDMQRRRSLEDLQLLFHQFTSNMTPEQLTLHRQAGPSMTSQDRFFTSQVVFNAGFFTPSNNHAYLALADGNLFVATKAGLFFHVPVAELETADQVQVFQVKSNFGKFVTYPALYVDNTFGFAIKDLHISEGYVYVSYVAEKSTDCYRTALLRAPLSPEYLEFLPFFAPDDCVSAPNGYGEFSALQSGGRIDDFEDGKLLFSVGEYRYRDHAQDPGNAFGKLLSLDKKTGAARILSMGHRNIQGLFYDASTRLIWMTEHGPKGGDEINLRSAQDIEGSIPNYGWPIASYGEHYEDDAATYLKAPLKKSHAANGFVEPMKYYTPSIGISPILRLPGFGDRTILAVGAMGFDPDEGDMSVHVLSFEDGKLTPVTILSLEDRVRDMIYSERLDALLYFGETSQSIGVLRFNREME